MTQYKNPFEDPEAELWGTKIKDYKIPEREETPLEEKAEKVSEIKGYIYVPTIKLYVAKEKSLYGKNWYEAHKELHKKGLQMLTIRQFIDFVLYLKGNPKIQDKIEIDDRVIDECWRGEWLDARFTKEKGYSFSTVPRGPPGGPSSLQYATFSKKAGIYLSYNHRTVNGICELVAQNIEPLEECLMKGKYFGSEDYYVDLKSCNKQGLPTKEGYHYENFYWHPEGKGCVAGFVRTSIWVGLHCRLGPTYSFPSLGVRAAQKLKRKKEEAEKKND